MLIDRRIAPSAPCGRLELTACMSIPLFRSSDFGDKSRNPCRCATVWNLLADRFGERPVTALISVSDKTGMIGLVRSLAERDDEILSTAALQGLCATPESSVTAALSIRAPSAAT